MMWEWFGMFMMVGIWCMCWLWFVARSMYGVIVLDFLCFSTIFWIFGFYIVFRFFWFCMYKGRLQGSSFHELALGWDSVGWVIGLDVSEFQAMGCMGYGGVWQEDDLLDGRTIHYAWCLKQVFTMVLIQGITEVIFTIGSFLLHLGFSWFSDFFGSEAILPIEVKLPSLRVSLQNIISNEEYRVVRLHQLELLDEKCLNALNNLQAYQNHLQRSYNKSKTQKFEVGELVLMEN